MTGRQIIEHLLFRRNPSVEICRGSFPTQTSSELNYGINQRSSKRRFSSRALPAGYGGSELDRGPTNDRKRWKNSRQSVHNHTCQNCRRSVEGLLTGRIEGRLTTHYKYKKEPTDIDFKQNPLYISQNSVRHHLFREQEFDLQHANERSLLDVLTSLTGLVRGYVVPA